MNKNKKNKGKNKNKGKAKATSIQGLYGADFKAKPKKMSADKALDFLELARKQAVVGAAYWEENWKLSKDDLLFKTGDQWPEDVKKQRDTDGRPCLVINTLPTFLDQIQGEQLQNKPSIKISPVSATMVDTKEGEQDALKLTGQSGQQYELGEVLSGLLRSIEYQCDAEDAYDVAFQALTDSGMGYLRVRTGYIDEESFQQNIIIEAIQDQFSVVLDPSATKSDYSDMGWAFIHSKMSKVEFEDKWPDATPSYIAGYSESEGMADWFPDGDVRVSEYFKRVPVIREKAQLSDGSAMYMEDIEPIVDELLEQGISIKRIKKVRTFKTYWHKITGTDILEGPIELKCSTVPIAPTWGKSTRIEDRVIFRSALRDAKDAVRMSNYYDSSLTEVMGQAPKAPWTGAEEHFEGYEDDWKNSNKANVAVLTYNKLHDTDTGPKRTNPTPIPSAEITAGQIFQNKIKDCMGLFNASLGQAGNETSGKAINARQRQGHTGSFKFIDNLSKGIARCAKISIELIPHIYDEGQKIRIKFEDGKEDFVEINKQVWDQETRKWVKIYDLDVVKYDVIVTTGPAYSTQREEASEGMLGFMAAVPAAATVMSDLVAQNMAWPGAAAVADRLKKTIPIEYLSKIDREALKKDMPEPEQPTPEQEMQQQVQKEEVEARKLESKAKIAEAEADIIKAEVEIKQAEMELNKIDESNSLETAQHLENTIKDLVADAITELAINNGDTPV